jgi:hypothetical protein
MTNPRLAEVIRKYPAIRSENQKLGKVLEYRLANTLRARLGNAVRRLKKYSKETAFPSRECAVDFLGCTLEKLKEHLESQFVEGMSWDNHGKWHVDHIRPVSSFVLGDIEDLKKCCHYTNLQPLWAADNLSKRADWDGCSMLNLPEASYNPRVIYIPPLPRPNRVSRKGTPNATHRPVLVSTVPSKKLLQDMGWYQNWLSLQKGVDH